MGRLQGLEHLSDVDQLTRLLQGQGIEGHGFTHGDHFSDVTMGKPSRLSQLARFQARRRTVETVGDPGFPKIIRDATGILASIDA